MFFLVQKHIKFVILNFIASQSGTFYFEYFFHTFFMFFPNPA